MTSPADTPSATPTPDAARLSTLSKALLRISASLDLETVLREVIDGARELTGASYGAIVTIDETKTPQDVVTSGLTEDQCRELEQWSDGLRLFEHLRDLPGPVRIADLATFVRPFGITWDIVPSRVGMSTPMRHLGAQVGNFFLGGKENEAEFTDEDEEMLLLFAAQAAVAIVNARTYRAEQRARADLETLVETSPIGVLVLDARTGGCAVFNREARRLVELLCDPGRRLEDMPDVMTCRIGDEPEFSLAPGELSRRLGRARTLRAEEIVLSTPDGRSVTLLLNSTPNRAEDGTVESVVVTVQDLAAFQALDRMRADFLGMVSHELRTPLAAVKGSTTTVLGTAQSFAPAETRQFFRIIDEQADRMSALIGDLLDAGRIDAGTLSVAAEPSEVGELVEQARTAFLSGGSRHTVLIDLPADLPRVMADRGRIVQVLNNLLANAARHSPEDAPVRISADRDGMHVAVAVTDEGQGISPERLAGLFRKYGGPRRRRAGGRERARARHLQGVGGGARRAHPGRERRSRPGDALHLHRPVGRGVGRRCGRGAEPARGAANRGAAPRPGGGRRPADAALRARCAARCGLCRGGGPAITTTCPLSSRRKSPRWWCST